MVKAKEESQLARIGDQTGGSVFLFLITDDIQSDYLRYTEKGVHFLNPPTELPHGFVAIFQDCFGNKWDLIQPHHC